MNRFLGELVSLYNKGKSKFIEKNLFPIYEKLKENQKYKYSFDDKDI